VDEDSDLCAFAVPEAQTLERSSTVSGILRQSRDACTSADQRPALLALCAVSWIGMTACSALHSVSGGTGIGGEWFRGVDSSAQGDSMKLVFTLIVICGPASGAVASPFLHSEPSWMIY
jgi:hypothetical protein